MTRALVLAFVLAFVLALAVRAPSARADGIGDGSAAPADTAEAPPDAGPQQAPPEVPAEAAPPSRNLDSCALTLDGSASAGHVGHVDAFPGVRAGLRLGPLYAVLSVDKLGAHRATHVDTDYLVLLGVGLARIRGDWLMHGAVGLGDRTVTFADTWGTGRVEYSRAVVWARAGVARRLPLARLLVARVGLDGTLGWAGHLEDRFRRAEAGGRGAVAIVALTLGLELRVPVIQWRAF